ncbi:unnamed protein product [Lactuca virosa]|uniref:BRCT domain-containing protein n=1 Tax=Lactuca virosa TaxID=75947 RepID=A0AAU9NRK4_9ASTR|nr:unnamed protein product [Lactuca virosa]
MHSLLGFHPPHFSEEAAWLPGWLQSSSIREASNQAFQCSSGQRLEDIGCLQQNMNTIENENLCDNGVCKSFHLFLSGEDNSTMNFPSCSSNHEIRFHLHLSSNEESQNLSNPTPSKSQLQPLPVPESKVTPEENTQNPSPQKGNSGISSHEPLKGQNGKTPKSHKVDITDAVELAVAASEALIIHEVVKDEPNSQLSTPSSVLEAAIRVKKARLEELNDDFEENNDNEYEVDFLSDLDELTMADAYEDVGLTVSGSCYESISHVKDSYGTLEAEFSSISTKQEILSKEGIVLESIEGDTHKEHDADLGCDFDPMFSCSVEQPDFCTKKVVLENEGKMTNLIQDRFQSRWFGCWTCKNEVGIPSVTDNKIPEKPFALNETSFFSESADIAPDMNSAIQKQDNTVSQSTIPPKDIDTHQKTTNNSNFLSHTAPDMSLSVSPMEDLLCSVVPCSFSSDNTPPHVNLHNPKSVSPQNTDNTLHQDNLKSVSPQNTDNTLHQNNLKSVSPQNTDNTLHENISSPIRRHVSSLKTYSILPHPPYDPYSVNKQPTQDDVEKKTKLPLATINKENPELFPTEVFRKVKSNIKSCVVPMRKRVRFSEPEIIHTKKTRVTFTCKKTRLFQDLKFLITGFSIKKHKEIKNLIQKNSGIVLDDIPSPPSSTSRRQKKFSEYRLPVILSPKRLLTTKFLYGCAVNASILKVKWLFDSVNEGSILPHKKYMILKEQVINCSMIIGIRMPSRLIFQDIAIMLHGKHDFCMKMEKVVRHGGGLVFKSFHWLVKRLETNRVLVGAIVVEGEIGISRQLKQCAVEQKISVVPFDWIVKSLYAGRVLPSLEEFKNPYRVPLEMSEEI